MKLDKDKTGLMVIDVWEDGPDNMVRQKMPHMQDVINKNMEEYIFPIIEFARNKNIPIIHSPSDLLTAIDIKEDELVVSNNKNSWGIIGSLELRNLVYIGYSLDVCVTYNITGLLNARERGYNTFVIKEATVSLYDPYIWEKSEEIVWLISFEEFKKILI